MLSFFTDPYPNELLLSAFSRYHYYSGNKSSGDTSKEIYAPVVSNSPDDYLDGLVCNLGGTYTKKELIFNHTLFPLEYFFQNETKYDDSFLHINKMLFFCPECAKNDIKSFGEAYFHREHQIENIIICPKHRVELKLYSTKTTWKNRWNYNKFDYKNLDLNDKKILGNSKYDELWSVSKMYYEILSHRLNECVNETVLNFYFIKLLRKQGFISSAGIYKKINLEKEVINFYGDDTLDFLDENYKKCKSLRWINDGLSEKQYNQYSFSRPYFYKPLHSIIMICFFKKSLNDIIDEIEIDYKQFNENPCENTLWHDTFMSYVNKGFTLTDISNHMDISIYKVWELAKKLNIEHAIKSGNLYISDEEHEIYKKQCLELIISNPGISRSELSHLLKSKYRSILDSSRIWWEENAPPSKNKLRMDKHNNKTPIL